MPAIYEKGVTPRDVARILFRHWKKIGLIFCSVVGLTLLAIAVCPRSFASEAKLLLSVGRESVALDPTATTGQTIMLQKTQVDEVNAALNILTSRRILEQVVERVGAEQVLDQTTDKVPSESTAWSRTMDGAAMWIREALIELNLSDPGTTMDQALRRLNASYSASAPKQSAVITIYYKAASPQLARDVVSAATSVFLEEHARLNRSDGSLKFFAEQTKKLRAELNAAQQELRDLKNTYQLTSSAGRRSVLEQAMDAMRTKVYELQQQENALMSRYTDEYPPLREVRRQRELAEQLLTTIPNIEGSGREVAGAGRVQSPANDRRGKPEAAPHSLVAKNKLDNELQTLNDQEFELAQLEREVLLLEGKYKMHVEKLEQARVNDAISRDKISNVKVAQPATLSYKPVSPKKNLILVGGLVLAFVASFGSAFLAESFDQTLRTTEQVERLLGLPVLASLPFRKRVRGQRKLKPMQVRVSASTALVPAPSGGQRHGGYRGLVALLRSVNPNGARLAKAIGVIGCETPRLRSQVAGNLAMEAASSGTDPVLLIDADARRRLIAKRFGLNGSPGWRDLISGRSVAKSCIQQSTPCNLSVMGPGGTNDEAESAPSAGSASLLDGIKTDYRLVVIDLPPAGEDDGLPIVASWVDEVVLVVEAERTRIQAAQRAKDMLRRAGVQVSGIVLANRRDYIPRWLYQRL